MRKILFILFVFCSMIMNSQTGVVDYNNWFLKGNSISSNTFCIGTTNNRSFYFKTNGTNRGKIDSSGNFKLYKNFSIDQSGGVNSVSPIKFSFQPYTAATTLPALYFSQNIPSTTNYFALADSNNHIINAPKSLLFRQGSQTILSIVGSQVNGQDGAGMAGGLVTISSCPATTTAQATASGYIPMLKLASLTYSMTNATVSSPYLIQVQTPNIKATQATTITEWVTMNFPKPTFDANITCTRMFGIQTNTDVSIGGNAYIGANSIAPSARLHLAAGNATLPAIQLTSQTLLTTTVQGCVERNSGVLYYTNATGRMQVGLSLTGSATLNFASTAAGAVSDLTLTVTGASLNDAVSVGAPNGAITATGMFYGWVSATDVVTIRFIHTHLINAEDPASGTFKVTVSKN